MILPDINVLVYAFRADAQHHHTYAEWLRGTVNSGESLALCDAVLAGFVRIVTHPKVASPPAPTARAIEFVDWLADAGGAHLVPPSRAVWRVFAKLADDRAVRGNLVPDAYLAAVCLAHGARLATAERGFARFPGLKWFDPG